VNVGELLRERDRLTGVIAEAKTARARLKQLNVLIAMYGDAPNVALVTADANGRALSETALVCEVCGKSYASRSGLNNHVTRQHGTPAAAVTCPDCGAGPFKGKSGLTMHNQRVHLGTVKTHRQTAKAKAK
jgi:hypothetical protein